MIDTPRPRAALPNLKLIEDQARLLERAIERQSILMWIDGVLGAVEIAPNAHSPQELFKVLIENINAGRHRP